MRKMEMLTAIATKGFERIAKAEKKLNGMAIASATAMEMYSIIIEIKDADEYREAWNYYENFQKEAKKAWKKIA